MHPSVVHALTERTRKLKDRWTCLSAPTCAATMELEDLVPGLQQVAKT